MADPEQLLPTNPVDGVQTGTAPSVADRAPMAEGSSSNATSNARFTILSHHAAGGLGRVHLARDEQLRRTVALKEIRPDRADDPRIRQRFLAEAEITGQLEHPGIVPIYALEKDVAGRPIYAMRFIQGKQLGEAIKAYHREPNSLKLRELLQRFVSVCQTLAYAHSRGVIHRDLKPANVMLGDYGETLVVDWGLAKRFRSIASQTNAESPSTSAGNPESGDGETTPAQTVAYAPAGVDTDSGQLTTAGQVLGTPAYMAPEQARGEIEALGPAADIYALGAIVYEILTGQPPYRGPSAMEVLEQVVSGPPPKPIARSRRAPHALNAVCEKAMARTASERYATCDELAREVERWLADEAVTAYPEPLTARLGRWSRRHRTLVTGTIVAVVLMLLTGGGFAWWRGQQEAAEVARLVRNDEQIAALLGQCEGALRRDDAVGAALVLDEAEKRTSDGGADKPAARLAQLRTELDMLQDLDRIDDMIWEVSEGKVQGPEKAAKAWPMALEKFGIVPGKTNAADAARVINESMIKDRLLSALERWHVATGSKDVLTILEAADRNEYRGKVRHAVSRKDETTTRLLADAHEALTQPPWFALALAQMKPIPVERRNRILKAAVQRTPSAFAVMMTLGELHNVRTGGEVIPRDAFEKETWYRAALAVRPRNATAWLSLSEALVFTGTDSDARLAAVEIALRIDPKYARAHLIRGRHLEERSDLEGAIKEFAEAVRLDPKFAGPRVALAQIAQKRGDVDGAIVECNEAIRADPTLAWTHSILGRLFVKKRDFDGAIRSFREALRLDPHYPGYYLDLVGAYKQQGIPDGGLAQFEEATKLHPKDAMAHYGLGIARFSNGDMEGAIASYQESIRLDPNHSFIHITLGKAHLQKGDRDAALASFRRAVALHPESKRNLAEVAPLLRQVGDNDGALAAYRRLMEHGIADAYYVLVDMYQKKGDFGGAVAEFEVAARRWPNDSLLYSMLGKARLLTNDRDGAIDAFKKADEAKDLKIRDTLVDLADAYAQFGIWNEAIVQYSKALTLKPKNVNVLFRRSNAYIETRQWPKVVADNSKLLEINGAKDWEAMLRRGRAYAHLGQYSEALADFASVRSQRPGHLGLYYRSAWQYQALAMLEAGNMTEYKKACTAICEPLGNQETPVAPVGAVWTCCVAPQAVTDYTPLATLAQVKANEYKSYDAQRALGAVLYRSDKWDQAVDQLNKAMQMQERSPSCWLLLAMAHHRAGRTDEARHWLSKAEQWIDDKGKEATHHSAGMPPPLWLTVSWTERLGLELLRQEAKSLVADGGK
jgi:serine/threonine protein kinase/tetratricopeptide (TPR) repeat protein